MALGLTGLAVFLRACDRGSLASAIASGLIAGLAINTKWTGLLAPGVIGLYAVTRRRYGLGIAAMVAAASVFAGWEAWIAWQYGQSHFLTHSERKTTPLMDRINGARALVSILGGVAPGVLVMGLVALGKPRSAMVAAFGTALGIAAIAFGLGPQAVFLTLGARSSSSTSARWRPGSSPSVRERRRVPRRLARDGGRRLLRALALFGRPEGAGDRGRGDPAGRPAGLTDGRRVPSSSRCFPMGIGLRDGARPLLLRRRLRRGRGRVVCRERRGSRGIGPRRASHSHAWFAARWGFRYQAEKSGLTPVVPGVSVVGPGDVLVVQQNQVIEEPRVVVDPCAGRGGRDAHLRRAPLLPPAPDGAHLLRGKNPLERQVGPRFVVHVYRITRPFTPLGLIPPWLGPKDRAVGAMMQLDRARR